MNSTKQPAMRAALEARGLTKMEKTKKNGLTVSYKAATSSTKLSSFFDEKEEDDA